MASDKRIGPIPLFGRRSAIVRQKRKVPARADFGRSGINRVVAPTAHGRNGLRAASLTTCFWHGVCDMARKLVEVENVNHPGQVRLVDAAMYDAMKQTLLKILPRTWPGLTVDEIYAKVATQLPKDLFPAGAKSVLRGRARNVG